MAAKAVEMAEDDAHGYSQHPPNGRWGPDYDCSSFAYEVADEAGYPVKARDGQKWTGTMTKDFKDAGFQILPFANVGIDGLEIGDILLNLAVHAEVYIGDGKVAGAQSSENGTLDGEAGDQTGTEITIQPVYTHSHGWNYVLRPPHDGEERGDQMALPGYFPQTTAPGWNQGGQASWTPNTNQGYPQGAYQQGRPAYNQTGYPQMGGQYNGYSQGYPQMGQQGAKFVSGVQEANERFVPAGVTECFLTNDWKHLIVKSADQQGYPSMRVFDIKECMEAADQGGYPQGGEWVSRQEFEQLKEMMLNGGQQSMGNPQSGGSQNAGSNSQSNNSGRRN